MDYNTNPDFFNKSLLNDKLYKTFLKGKVINSRKHLYIKVEKGLSEIIKIEKDENKDEDDNENKDKNNDEDKDV